MRKHPIADHNIEVIHNYILYCGVITTAKYVSENIHLSIDTIYHYIPEVMRRFDDIETVNGVGYRKKGIEWSYSVTANLYSSTLNDYIYHWEGKNFKRCCDYEKAVEFWNGWAPSKDSIKKQVDSWRMEFPDDELELEVGLWDGNGDEVEFYNGSINRWLN